MSDLPKIMGTEIILQAQIHHLKRNTLDFNF